MRRLALLNKIINWAQYIDELVLHIMIQWGPYWRSGSSLKLVSSSWGTFEDILTSLNSSSVSVVIDYHCGDSKGLQWGYLLTTITLVKRRVEAQKHLPPIQNIESGQAGLGQLCRLPTPICFNNNNTVKHVLNAAWKKTRLRDLILNCYIKKNAILALSDIWYKLTPV